MSYCVNCGVELATSEQCCPLCNTEVINPSNPWREPEGRPYPKRVERVLEKINRKYVVMMISLLMLIPLILPTLTDILFNRAITWSAYVIGGDICIFMLVVFPFLYEIPRPYLYILIDTVTLTGYIALISYMTSRFSWFLPLGLPLVLTVGTTVTLFVYILRRYRLSGFYRAAILNIVVALSCISIEITVSHFVGIHPLVLWSWFVVASGMIIATIMIILERRKKLRDEIIKRLFI